VPELEVEPATRSAGSRPRGTAPLSPGARSCRSCSPGASWSRRGCGPGPPRPD